MAVSVQCPHCQAKLSLKSESALGKKLACPKCKKPFKAEAPADDDPMAFLNDSEIEDHSPPPEEDEDEEEKAEEERKARGGKSGKKSKKKPFNPMPYILGGVGLVVGLAFLAGFGILIWTLINSRSGGLDLSWISPNAEVIGKVKVREFAQSPFAQSIFAGNAGTEIDRNLMTALGVGMGDVDSITFGMDNASSMATMNPMTGPGNVTVQGSVVVRALKTLDQNKVRQSLLMGEAATASGKSYHRRTTGAQKVAVYFPGDSLMVIADDATMQSLLASGGPSVSRSELSIVDQTAHLFFVAIPKRGAQPQQIAAPPSMAVMPGAPTAEELQALQKVLVSVMEVTATQDLMVQMRWNCEDEATATTVKAIYDGQVVKIKPIVDNPFAGALLGSWGKPLGELLASIQTKSEGKTGTMSMKIPASIKEPINELIASAGSGGMGDMPAGMPGMPAGMPGMPAGGVDTTSLNVPADAAPAAPAANTGTDPVITPTAVPIVLP